MPPITRASIPGPWSRTEGLPLSSLNMAVLSHEVQCRVWTTVGGTRLGHRQRRGSPNWNLFNNVRVRWLVQSESYLDVNLEPQPSPWLGLLQASKAPRNAAGIRRPNPRKNAVTRASSSSQSQNSCVSLQRRKNAICSQEHR